MPTKTVLITGASSGIGEAAAVKLQSLGCTVYAAARRTGRMAHLANRGIRVLELDVTDPASCRTVVDRIAQEAGGIDVLVNNAGYGSYGAVEDMALQDARNQFDVNVFGAAELIRLVLPRMRQQRSGRIVNISSMGGRIHTPLGGWYHATKFALEGLSDCLRLELKPFGVDVVLVEPGSIRTEWGGIAAGKLRETSGHGPYSGQAEAMARTLDGEANARFSSPPSVVADAVARAVTDPRPRTRYVVGAGARPLILLRTVLPDRAFDTLMRVANRLPR
jgi:NAD(P)-dependent dehydrogenase (short-subunit alcohol dehydrogenase family)